MELSIHRGRLRLILLSIWTFLVVAGFCVEAWKYLLFLDDEVEWLFVLGLSYEQNLPTWYSASLLLCCAVLLSLITVAKCQAKQAFRWHWGILALVFFYISLDETITLHEDLSDLLELGGAFYFSWVVPAGIFVFLLGLFYLPFVIHLPAVARRQFVIAGVIYVGGALGVELILGYWTDLHGTKNIGYGLIDLVEESMEILGTTLFLLGLVQYIAAPGERVQIRVLERAGREDSVKKSE